MSPSRWLRYSLLLLFIAAGALVLYFQKQQVRREPLSAGPLAAEKGYGVTIDLTQYDDEKLQETLEALHASGLTWLRQPVRWAQVEPEPGQFNWQPLDRITTAITTFNHPPNHPTNPPTHHPTIQPSNQPPTQPTNHPPLTLIPVLHTSPPWARAPHTFSTAPPADPRDFGRFAQAFAARYGRRIDHYQIWDEPNLSANWGHTFVDAPAYAALLREAALNLRAADAEAVIVAAALAPTLENGPLNLNEIDYLDRLYRVNARRWFDVVAAQPYGFDRAPSDVPDSSVLNFRRVELLRRVMHRHGDAATPIWATAFGWNALPSDWSGPKSPWKSGPPEQQARRTAEAIDLARRDWPWLGPMLAIRWDSTGLDRADPARGFVLLNTPPVLVALQAAATGPTVATPGSYPAGHPSGRYSPSWRFAAGQADVPRHQPRTLSIPFEGTRLDLMVNRGDYRGYLWVTIDGQPANALPRDSQGRSYVVLYDPLRETAVVTLARDLPPGRHRAEIVAEGGWGQWAIAGWTVTNRAASTFTTPGIIIAGVVLLLSGAALGGVAVSRWLTSLAARSAALLIRIDERLQFIFAAGLAAGLYFGAGNVAPALLIGLSVCLFLRPDFGLLLIAFGLSFLPSQKPVPLLDLSLLEALLLFSTIGEIRAVVSGQRSGISGQLVAVPSASCFVLPSLFVALGVVATVFAENFGVSMFGWRTMVLGPVAFYILVILVARPISPDPSALTWRLSDAFVAGAGLHALLALYLFFFDSQYVVAEGVRRAIGPIYPTPNNLALFLERVWPIVVAVALLPGRSMLRRTVYGLAGVVVTTAIYFTFSRGSLLLALPAGLIGMALLAGLGRWHWRRGLIATGLAMLLLAAALLPLLATERSTTLLDFSRGTTFFRLKLWQSALMMLRDHWPVGVGLDNFLYAYRTFYILPEAWPEPNLSHPHNLILDFGTSLGIGGIIIFLGLQIQFWVLAWKTYERSLHPLLLGLMGSMLVILSHGLVDHAYFLVDLAFAFFLIFGLVQRMRLNRLLSVR